MRFLFIVALSVSTVLQIFAIAVVDGTDFNVKTL